jgi:hypothetical protein
MLGLAQQGAGMRTYLQGNQYQRPCRTEQGRCKHPDSMKGSAAWLHASVRVTASQVLTSPCARPSQWPQLRLHMLDIQL